MTLPQPYNLSNSIKRDARKSLLSVSHRFAPDIQESLSEVAIGQRNLPILRDDLHTRPIGKSSFMNSMADMQEGEVSPESEDQDLISSLHTIHRYDTRYATLVVLSCDPHLSVEKILEMFIEEDRLYWGYYLSPDKTFYGYLGVYYAAEVDPDAATACAHTYIGITWPSHTKIHLINRLRMLAQEGCRRLPFWSALVGAIVATHQSLEHRSAPKGYTQISSLPAYFSRLNYNTCNANRIQSQGPSIDVIERCARFLAAPKSTALHPKLPDDMDECGQAFLLLALAKALWLPESLRDLGWIYHHDPELVETFHLFSQIADQWINLANPDQIEIAVSGVKLKYDVDKYTLIVGLWKQTVEYERWKIPPEALKFFQRYLNLSKVSGIYCNLSGFDKEYCDALAQKLITEAQQRCVFVPYGGFRTAVMPCLPIKGIEELCIWSNGTGLWVLPRPTGAIFYWQPDYENPISRYLGDTDFLSAWNLILAALWHDLVTEGSKVIVRTGDEQPATDIHHVECKSCKRHSHSRPDTHVLRLPSQRVIHMDGVHTWGTPEEIEKIKRQAHQVRGHRRKLLPGHQRSLYALENARRFNFIMPDGYTFVKPYQTGLSDPDAPATKETPILARGLASLMLMSKDYSKRSAES
jgi:hypothetical protein